MLSCIEGRECQPVHPEVETHQTKTCGSNIAFPYFVSFIFFCSFLVHTQDDKNLWHRKCVRRTIFRNVEVRVERGFLTLQHSHWVIVRSVRGHLAPKMNITFFFTTNWALNILLTNFFEKKAVYFLEKLWKTVLGDKYDNFLEKGGVLAQKLI